MAFKIENTRQFKNYIRNILDNAQLNKDQRDEGDMPIITHLSGFTSNADTLKSVARYDSKLASLLEKVEQPIQEMDAYILGRKFEG